MLKSSSHGTIRIIDGRWRLSEFYQSYVDPSVKHLFWQTLNHLHHPNCVIAGINLPSLKRRIVWLARLYMNMYNLFRVKFKGSALASFTTAAANKPYTNKAIIHKVKISLPSCCHHTQVHAHLVHTYCVYTLLAWSLESPYHHRQQCWQPLPSR